MKSLDIAAYIIKLSSEIGEPITNMKLQKLLYYSYVVAMVEKGLGYKLFNDDEIQAWKFGPVIPTVYQAYSIYGADVIKESIDGNISALSQEIKDIIDDVFTVYGNKTAVELMALTHSEQPWLQIYSKSKPNQTIPDELIYKFYKSKFERIAAS